MTQSKFLSLLGLCAKAGKCLAGETACFSALRAGTAKLVLLLSDASENTKKRAADGCAYRGVPLLLCPQDTDCAAGKPGRKLFAVTDANFAEKLQQLLANPSNDRGGAAHE